VTSALASGLRECCRDASTVWRKEACVRTKRLVGGEDGPLARAALVVVIIATNSAPTTTVATADLLMPTPLEKSGQLADWFNPLISCASAV